MLNNVLITGGSGFVAKSLKEYLKFDYELELIRIRYPLSSQILKDKDVIVHLAGKVHDLKNVTSPQEYYDSNFELTMQLYDSFLLSDSKVFIFMSTVKAVADTVNAVLSEEEIPNPQTHYGISKLKAEQYILSKVLQKDKRFYVLRPCLIHGNGNKGNLNLLYKVIVNRIPWPLGSFKNKRSFCSVDNLLFIIKELIEREDIPSGVYNIADDSALSTNEVISIIAKSQGRTPIIWKLPKQLINLVAKFGDVLKLPLNTERLIKLTESYVVNNNKIKMAIGKPLPISAMDGLFKTFQSFKSKKV